jgi:hypothetical protein
MFSDRLDLYRELESKRKSKLLVFITGDRQGMETQMHPEVLDMFVEHLDSFGNHKKITLFIHTRGGETSAGWSIANLIRSFCDEFEVIVPARAHSSGTLVCLGADRIVMTKQATLGPVDPSVNSPLNPQMPGAGPQVRVPVSVESIKGFVQLAKEELGIRGSRDITQVMSILASNVHPLVLGDVFRARTHIRMLARNLLEKQIRRTKNSKEKISKIVNFLCSDSGSHNYTINRTEARENLGLNIERPDENLYSLIMKIYRNIEDELELRKPFIPGLLVSSVEKTDFCCRRALIESIDGRTNVFVSEGSLVKQQVATPNGLMMQIQDIRTSEGWRKENV